MTVVFATWKRGPSAAACVNVSVYKRHGDHARHCTKKQTRGIHDYLSRLVVARLSVPSPGQDEHRRKDDRVQRSVSKGAARDANVT